MDHADTTPRCVNCTRQLHPIEASRWACSGCQQRAAGELQQLPALTAAAARQEARYPIGSNWGAGGHRGSAPGPRVLADVDAIVGPYPEVIAGLVSCVKDWIETGGMDYPEWPTAEQAQLDTLCRWLRWHLDWACGMHAGVGDSLHTISRLRGHLHTAATGERGERPVRLACPCGGVIPWRASHDHYRCGGCGQQYGREQAAALPRAPRRHAAAA